VEAAEVDRRVLEEASVPIRFFEQTIEVLASAGDTNRVLGAVEVASPRGAAPPLHVHHREDEAFYVVEGEYSVFVGDDVASSCWGRPPRRGNPQVACRP
jgi:uncharacterized cupin superfamily protein